MQIKELIRDLNIVLNGELASANRNILQLATVVGANSEKVQSTYRRRIALEMRHAQVIADLIVMYAGVPFIDSIFTLPPNCIRASARHSLKEMLKGDALEEQDDAREYSRLAKAAEALGLMGAKRTFVKLAGDKTRLAEEIWQLLDNAVLLAQAVRLSAGTDLSPCEHPSIN